MPLKTYLHEGDKDVANGVAGLDGSGQLNPSVIPDGINAMVVSFGSSGTDYVQTGSSTYARLASFSFPGTNLIGDVQSININGWRNGSDEVSFRIYDATNAMQIAEITAITSTSDLNLVSMGAISNLPVSAAVFEIQGLRNAAGGTPRARCGSVEFIY